MVSLFQLYLTDTTMTTALLTLTDTIVFHNPESATELNYFHSSITTLHKYMTYVDM